MHFNKEFKFLLTKGLKRINFSKMTLRSLILLASGAALFTGCATFGEKDKVVEGLNRQISDLQTSLNETNSRLDELGNKFILLNEKLDASSARIDKLSAVTPPEGLAVVQLGDEGHKAERQAEAPKAEAPVKLEIKDSKPEKVLKLSVTEEKTKAPDAMYLLGQDLFTKGKYNESRKVFTDFVKAYPNHSLSDNALYWVGESYYTEKDFEKAASKFKEAFDRYPKENKAPDALLKAGYSYMEANDREKAVEALEKLVRRYPGSQAAGQAKKALERLGAKKEGSR